MSKGEKIGGFEPSYKKYKGQKYQMNSGKTGTPKKTQVDKPNSKNMENLKRKTNL